MTEEIEPKVCYSAEKKDGPVRRKFHLLAKCAITAANIALAVVGGPILAGAKAFEGVMIGMFKVFEDYAAYEVAAKKIVDTASGGWVSDVVIDLCRNQQKVKSLMLSIEDFGVAIIGSELSLAGSVAESISDFLGAISGGETFGGIMSTLQATLKEKLAAKYQRFEDHLKKYTRAKIAKTLYPFDCAWVDGEAVTRNVILGACEEGGPLCNVIVECKGAGSVHITPCTPDDIEKDKAVLVLQTNGANFDDPALNCKGDPGTS
eukprot:g3449.t1